MAYTPTEWKTGDVITAAKLNNMEQGIETSVHIFDATNIQPFDGLIKTGVDFDATTAYPVPSYALQPNAEYLIDEDGSKYLAYPGFGTTTASAEDVSLNYYVLPVGTVYRRSWDGNIYYDESITPIPGEEPA